MAAMPTAVVPTPAVSRRGNRHAAFRLLPLAGVIVCAAFSLPAAAFVCDGDASAADGQTLGSSAPLGFACGSGNLASGGDATAIGISNSAFGTFSTAVGYVSRSFGDFSSAYGTFAVAGDITDPTVRGGLAVGGFFDRNGDLQVTNDIDMDGDGTNDVSSETAAALGLSSVAVGAGVLARGPFSSAFGVNSFAMADRSVAFGYNSYASGVLSTAAGSNNTADGDQSAVFGTGNTGDGENSSAIGSQNLASGDDASAIGTQNTASGARSVVLGYASEASADDSTAIGQGATASTEGSVALGAGSSADRGTALSIGSTGSERQIIHVAAGTADTDAVNLSQLVPFADTLGASVAGGVWSAPSYTIQGGSYSTVPAAFDAIDDALSDLDDRVSDLEVLPPGAGPQGPAGDSAYQVAVDNGFVGDEEDWLASLVGPQGEPGIPGPAGEGGAQGAAGDGCVTGSSASALQCGAGSQASGAGSVALGSGAIADEANTVSVGSAGSERRITNVAEATQGSDAVTLDQMQAGDAQTLDAANAYTDAQVGAVREEFSAWQGNTDRRLAEHDQRINVVGALSAAMAMATPDARLKGDTAVSLGVGSFRNEQALAGSVAHRFNDRVAVRLGGAFASAGESSVGAGVSIGW